MAYNIKIIKNVHDPLARATRQRSNMDLAIEPDDCSWHSNSSEC